VEEGLAEVLEVAEAHFSEHLELIDLHQLEHKLLITRLEELRLRLPSRVIMPMVRLEDRVDEILIRSRIELPQSLKLGWEENLHLVLYLLLEHILNLIDVLPGGFLVLILL